jgi:flagellin
VFSAVNLGGVTTDRATGTDVDLRINGIQAKGDGLRASINTATLDLSFEVSVNIQDGDEFSFSITGGGAIFQIGPDVVSNQQARLGIQGLSTATLGGASGKLYEIRTNGGKDLFTDTKGAARIVDEVIGTVTGLRGRLGAFQKTTLETNIITLSDTLENLTEAESLIRDADFAAESARLTRAQILVQSGTSVLAIANQNPQNVLNLLR